MVRDDLYIAVPSFFRCNLRVLDRRRLEPHWINNFSNLYPMSLCTGVTYDRTNIQIWSSTPKTSSPIAPCTASSRSGPTRSTPTKSTQLTATRLLPLPSYRPGTRSAT
ncbi:hypothetical protein Pyn_32218 [Prunus yedoensis var. nudiflora]|uniref:Uncharacterized protein n=1 Tax=Prunus yedoensis var. nudiflora TaxID=2094558 RepID=A0A314US27_PRUYE|nr:hypothetical protein Pyn_32218 [Prunus yedoensis var. nudiflora]